MKGFKGISAKDKFLLKTAMKQQAFPEDVPQPLDLSAGERLYGKVDYLNSAVRLMVESTDSLALLKGGEGVSAINFVARAFADLRRDYDASIAKKALQPVMGIETLTPVRGWSDFGEYYNGFVQSFRQRVLRECVQKYDKSIRNFSDFTKVCFQIMRRSREKIYVTKTGLMMSRMVPNHVSGLVIDLLPNSKSDEFAKIDMLSSPAFRIFAHKCGKYGFRLNRESPWSLIANVGSAKMSEYADVSGVTFSPLGGNFFERFYMKTHLEDMDTLRSLLPNLYNEFISMRPDLVVQKYSADNKLQSQKYRRRPLVDPSYGYDLQFWMEVLLKVRLMETALFTEMHQKKFDAIIKECMSVEKRYGLEIALNHLNQGVKNVNYDLNFFAKNMRNFFTPKPLHHIMLTIHKK